MSFLTLYKINMAYKLSPCILACLEKFIFVELLVKFFLPFHFVILDLIFYTLVRNVRYSYY